MNGASPTHGILIPAFNAGRKLAETVAAAAAVWPRVLVVDDASTDGCADFLRRADAVAPGVALLSRKINGGKGAAVLAGAERALAEGWTHALVLDADGQHPIDRIQDFMAISTRLPRALIVGQPQFGPEAPKARLYGRKLSVWLVKAEAGRRAIEDPLFGFRVYPLAPLVAVMNRIAGARRYDFDPEVAVRLVWAGVPTANIPAACRYVPKAEGGVSHFHYVRDNVRMVALHTRLLTHLCFWQGWRRFFRRLAGMSSSKTIEP